MRMFANSKMTSCCYGQSSGAIVCSFTYHPCIGTSTRTGSGFPVKKTWIFRRERVDRNPSKNGLAMPAQFWAYANPIHVGAYTGFLRLAMLLCVRHRTPSACESVL
ncbi:uncharacterized protein PV07_09211 [Cladophialophora immunda]|uniref:Uncharacterized protein n=1 Tax=Cladophialophora immunda TaxID=569365 RepID=A0A0D2C4K1_9EURO|nr:uncharacterized protein PV07_09211 [Cladophialophora immunda]KIW26083.1 hypothetical protein PV07_09211 [Cladophialophora immunda]